MSDDIMQFLALEIEYMSPSDYRTACNRNRPYNGQPQTDTGARGATELRGITFRDLRDSFIIGAFACASDQYDFCEQNYGSIYDIDWHNIDPLALVQNMSCELEKRMGIYPNIPPLKEKDV